MDKETIKSILLAHGFTIKPGETDLKPYVYKAAFELLELAAPDVQGEPVGWQPADEMRFEYRHPKTGEAYTIKLSREEVMEMMEQELFDKLTACFCGCETIGETYVVDCCCDEYADQFELVTAPQPATALAKEHGGSDAE